MNESDFPGPQNSINPRISERMYACALLFGVCLLLAQAIIRENVHTKSWIIPWLWKVKIVDASVCVTILIAFATIGVARKQIALGLRPFVTYGIKPPNTSSPHLSDSGRYRLVTIGNEGAGTALLIGVTVSITFRNPREVCTAEEFDRLYDILMTRNLAEGRDYTIRNMGAGFTVAPHSDVRLMEYTDDFLATVGRLDIEITFEGLLGDKYRKGIYCVPRRIERALDGGEPIP
ncbi:hypothetical protein OG920_22100 [Streptomyces europaeiscabiei]|uniref:hypothetical protein n=1 Tax=Streptomyces europaeiscabiei TaxID=146819 RepID=UPI0030E516D0